MSSTPETPSGGQPIVVVAAVVLLLLILVGGAGWLFLAVSHPSPPTHGAPPPAVAAAPTIAAAPLMQDVKLQFEAEAFTVDAPMKVVDGAMASGGKCLTVPEGPNKQEAEPPFRSEDGRRIKHTSKGLVWMDTGEKVPQGTVRWPNGMAYLEFEIPSEGEYELWARHYWPHSCADSFNYWIGTKAEFDAIDDQWPELLAEAKPFKGQPANEHNPTWTWGRPNQVDDPLSLNAGKHVMVVLNREDGMLVDKFMLTTIPADDWVPAGATGN